MGTVNCRKFEKKINLMPYIMFYMFFCLSCSLFANSLSTTLEEPSKQNINANLNVTLRILSKLTGKTQDIILSNKQDLIELSSLKTKYKSAFIEKVTASTKALWVFVEIWYKDTQFTTNEWTLQYSNWLCNLEDRFENKEWGIHILDIK